MKSGVIQQDGRRQVSARISQSLYLALEGYAQQMACMSIGDAIRHILTDVLIKEPTQAAQAAQVASECDGTP